MQARKASRAISFSFANIDERAEYEDHDSDAESEAMFEEEEEQQSYESTDSMSSEVSDSDGADIFENITDGVTGGGVTDRVPIRPIEPIDTFAELNRPFDLGSNDDYEVFGRSAVCMQEQMSAQAAVLVRYLLATWKHLQQHLIELDPIDASAAQSRQNVEQNVFQSKSPKNVTTRRVSLNAFGIDNNPLSRRSSINTAETGLASRRSSVSAQESFAGRRASVTSSLRQAAIAANPFLHISSDFESSPTGESSSRRSSVLFPEAGIQSRRSSVNNPNELLPGRRASLRTSNPFFASPPDLADLSNRRASLAVVEETVSEASSENVFGSFKSPTLKVESAALPVVAEASVPLNKFKRSSVFTFDSATPLTPKNQTGVDAKIKSPTALSLVSSTKSNAEESAPFALSETASNTQDAKEVRPDASPVSKAEKYSAVIHSADGSYALAAPLNGRPRKVKVVEVAQAKVRIEDEFSLTMLPTLANSQLRAPNHHSLRSAASPANSVAITPRNGRRTSVLPTAGFAAPSNTALDRRGSIAPTLFDRRSSIAPMAIDRKSSSIVQPAPLGRRTSILPNELPAFNRRSSILPTGPSLPAPSISTTTRRPSMLTSNALPFESTGEASPTNAEDTQDSSPSKEDDAAKQTEAKNDLKTEAQFRRKSKLSGPFGLCRVGIIGAGRIGQAIAATLLTQTSLSAKQLLIATRRPDQLSQFQSIGVVVTDDILMVMTLCHIVFLCVPPHALSSIANTVRSRYHQIPSFSESIAIRGTNSAKQPASSPKIKLRKTVSIVPSMHSPIGPQSPAAAMRAHRRQTSNPAALAAAVRSLSQLGDGNVIDADITSAIDREERLGIRATSSFVRQQSALASLDEGTRTKSAIAFASSRQDGDLSTHPVPPIENAISFPTMSIPRPLATTPRGHAAATGPPLPLLVSMVSTVSRSKLGQLFGHDKIVRCRPIVPHLLNWDESGTVAVAPGGSSDKPNSFYFASFAFPASTVLETSAAFDVSHQFAAGHALGDGGASFLPASSIATLSAQSSAMAVNYTPRPPAGGSELRIRVPSGPQMMDDEVGTPIDRRREVPAQNMLPSVRSPGPLTHKRSFNTLPHSEQMKLNARHQCTLLSAQLLSRSAPPLGRLLLENAEHLWRAVSSDAAISCSRDDNPADAAPTPFYQLSSIVKAAIERFHDECVSEFVSLPDQLMAAGSSHIVKPLSPRSAQLVTNNALVPCNFVGFSLSAAKASTSNPAIGSFSRMNSFNPTMSPRIPLGRALSKLFGNMIDATEGVFDGSAVHVPLIWRGQLARDHRHRTNFTHLVGSELIDGRQFALSHNGQLVLSDAACAVVGAPVSAASMDELNPDELTGARTPGSRARTAAERGTLAASELEAEQAAMQFLQQANAVEEVVSPLHLAQSHPIRRPRTKVGSSPKTMRQTSVTRTISETLLASLDMGRVAQSTSAETDLSIFIGPPVLNRVPTNKSAPISIDSDLTAADSKPELARRATIVFNSPTNA